MNGDEVGTLERMAKAGVAEPADVLALVAEVRRLRKDAMRWAFIRDSGKLAVNQMRLLDGTDIASGYVGGPYADAAVDAMIARAALGDA